VSIKQKEQAIQTVQATRILIVYYRRYETVKALATFIAAGMQREPGVETRKSLSRTDMPSHGSRRNLPVSLVTA